MIETMLKMINLKENCGIETMITTFKRHTTVGVENLHLKVQFQKDGFNVARVFEKDEIENHVKETSEIIEDMIELVKTGG